MIVVIADDLSGAAELAGAALRHGLSAEVQTGFLPATDAEVVCLDTDTRLLPPAEAANRVAAIARDVIAAKPAWIFKKCDSVLRGAVLAEARALADAIGRQRILLIPANPSRGRTIRGGKYFIDGQPLSETSFASDPAHPRRISKVKALLGDALDSVDVPDINSEDDVRQQAIKIDARALPVGAADFFTALLEARVPRKALIIPGALATGKTLLVCGSAASWPQRHAEAKARGIPAFVLGHGLDAAANSLGANDCVLIGIGENPAGGKMTSTGLTRQLAETVAAILVKIPVERLLIEGGATSAAVITALGWTRLRAEEVAGSGVGVLRPIATQAPLLFIKPGSYAWPAAIWS